MAFAHNFWLILVLGILMVLEILAKSIESKKAKKYKNFMQKHFAQVFFKTFPTSTSNKPL